MAFPVANRKNYACYAPVDTGDCGFAVINPAVLSFIRFRTDSADSQAVSVGIQSYGIGVNPFCFSSLDFNGANEIFLPWEHFRTAPDRGVSVDVLRV